MSGHEASLVEGTRDEMERKQWTLERGEGLMGLYEAMILGQDSGTGTRCVEGIFGEVSQ